MSNPFAHDTTSNAQTDFRFADDAGVPNIHREAFTQAMGGPGSSSLAEEDYRYPPGQQTAPVSNTAQPTPARAPWQPPGHFPEAYAP